MEISNIGIALIKEFEGLRSNAYLDVADIPTIGYGTTIYASGKKVKLGDRITEDRAEMELKVKLKGFAEVVDNLVKVDLTQNQFDALVSFVYNVGGASLASSTLLKRLNTKDYLGAANEFLRWNKATVKGTRVAVAGLTRRRVAERTLFLQP